MKSLITILLFAALTNLNCGSISPAGDSNNEFDFKQLVFQSGRCNGTCPTISMNVYNDKRIELSRNVFKSKGATDSAASGNFKGVLSDSVYHHLTDLLKAIQWDTLTYSKVTCCDRPIKTIILKYDTKQKEIKSMDMPPSTHELVTYLTDLGANITLNRYAQSIDFEDTTEK